MSCAYDTKGPTPFSFPEGPLPNRPKAPLEHAHPVLVLISAPADHRRLFMMLLVAVFFLAKLGRGRAGQRRDFGLGCRRWATRRRRWQTGVPADLFLPDKWDVGPFGETLRRLDQRVNGLEPIL